LKKAEETASYPDVSLSLSLDENVRAKEGGKETAGETALRLPSVPFPWSLAVHHPSLASTLRKTKRLRRRLPWKGLLKNRFENSYGSIVIYRYIWIYTWNLLTSSPVVAYSVEFMAKLSIARETL